MEPRNIIALSLLVFVSLLIVAVGLTIILSPQSISFSFQQSPSVNPIPPAVSVRPIGFIILIIVGVLTLQYNLALRKKEKDAETYLEKVIKSYRERSSGTQEQKPEAKKEK